MFKNRNGKRVPNYHDMSGEPAAASAQHTTGTENGPTAAETVTGTTQERDNDAQTVHKYTSQYGWLFKLQAYLELIDRDCDLVIRLAKTLVAPYPTSAVLQNCLARCPSALRLKVFEQQFWGCAAHTVV